MPSELPPAAAGERVAGAVGVVVSRKAPISTIEALAMEVDELTASNQLEKIFIAQISLLHVN